MFIATIIVLTLHCLSVLKGDECSEIDCSNIVDLVCGVAERDNIRIFRIYHNICHLNRIRCRLKSKMDIYHVADAYCDIKKDKFTLDPKRRLNDYTIVGAHQACNHTCPTYCVDTYEPACAKIWTRPATFKYRPMINHCHIDLLSCAAGVNVTVEPLARCYKNPSGLLFMMQTAALKSLKLLDEIPTRITNVSIVHARRRYMDQWTAKNRLSELYKKVLNLSSQRAMSGAMNGEVATKEVNI